VSIVEIKGGPITHRYLMNKTKDELASMAMRQLRDIEMLATQQLAAHKSSDGFSCSCQYCCIARGYLCD